MEIPRIESKLEVQNKADGPAELYLYGPIRKNAYWWEDEDSDFISSKKVRSALKDVKNKTLKVHLNSGGGDVFESIAISNILKNYEGDVEIYIDALAASGASIIAASGSKVYMYNNSMQMIHKAWTVFAGNADDFKKQAEDLEKIDSSVKASYMDRFVGEEKELSELLKDETWLTAEECLAFGLCDEIIEKEESEPKPEPENFKATLFNKYKKNIVAKQKGDSGNAIFKSFVKKD